MAKTWEYRGRVIEEDFESWTQPGAILKTRTGYVIRHPKYEDKNWLYIPGRYRSLAEAKRMVDELNNEEV